MITASINTPDVFTKILTIIRYQNGTRKVQISSNLLAPLGFEKGVKVIENHEGDSNGYTVRLSKDFPLVTHTKRVYSRTYATRRSNPFELTFETSSKRILSSIPDYVDKVHVTMTYGLLRIVPILNNVAKRIEAFMKRKRPFSIFGACTSGVDLHAAKSEGFDIDSVVEYRPAEARDQGKDRTETGMLSVLSNLEVKQAFNENIEEIDVEMLKAYYDKYPSSLFTISLNCCEFSNLKPESKKKESFEDGTSTLDMAYDGLRIIEKLKPPMVLLEQVGGFWTNSDLGRMWSLRLRRWGYHVYQAVLNGLDYGCNSPRPRFYLFATILPSEFSFPTEEPRRTVPIWNDLVTKYIGEEVTVVERGKQVTYVGSLRDVSHSKSLMDGLLVGRARVIDRDSLYCPSLSRSQSQMAKDSVTIEYDGRLLFPSLEFEAEIMGIPDSFDNSINNCEVASQIHGQSVDYTLYKKIIQSVKGHILSFLGVQREQLLSHF